MWGLELKEGWIRENPTLRSQCQCLPCCSPVLEDTSLGESAQIIPVITSFKSSYSESHSYHVISKYEQSDWFSRFLVNAESASPRFRQSVPDLFTSSRRQGSRNETMTTSAPVSSIHYPFCNAMLVYSYQPEMVWSTQPL